MGRCPAPKVPLKRRPIAAVVLSSVLTASALAACEYTYDDGRAPLPARPPVVTDPVLPRDPRADRTVSGEALKAWAQEALPDGNGQSFYISYGFLGSGESRTERTVQLPAGTYAVSLACRGARRASYLVRDSIAQDSSSAVVDLALECGTTRVNVVELPKSSVLVITVEAVRRANFAYRVSRI